MKIPARISDALIAPCGINCLACSAHVRAKNPCPGCWLEGAGKPGHCLHCSRKLCAQQQGLTLCVECARFPCQRIKSLDKTYQQRYGFSPIADARRLKTMGMEVYLREEQARWTCPACGGVIDMHLGRCSECGEK